MDEPKPPRRWFRFTLKTLFLLIVLFCIPLGWLAWQRSIVHQRAAFLDMVTSSGGTYCVFYKPSDKGRMMCILMPPKGKPEYFEARLPNDQPDPPTFPLGPGSYRRSLNDKVITVIEIPKDLPSTVMENAQSLFPEAKIRRSGP